MANAFGPTCLSLPYKKDIINNIILIKINNIKIKKSKRKKEKL